MIDLSTDYLGLKLDNPLVPSSSPLTGTLDSARQLEDAGAAAIIMPSLFEEAIENEQMNLERFVHFQSLGNFETESYHPIPDNYHSELDSYLENLQQFKSALDIPVIASLNGISNNGWIEYGKDLENAGADALELNVYYIAADPQMPSDAIELRYTELLKELLRHVSIPVCMKLSSQFSSMGNMVKQLEDAGAKGVSLFNRFYLPDIDLETLEIKPQLTLSTSHESLLRIRWVALIRQHVKLSLAVTGGFHNTDDIVKAILAGADAVHLCSVLLQEGSDHIRLVKLQLEQWLEEHEYKSISQMKGSLNKSCAINPDAYEHTNYMDVLDSYSSATGVNH